MNEREAVGGGALDERLSDALISDAGVGPIEPDKPVNPVAKELAKLKIVKPDKAAILSGDPQKVFAAIQRLEQPGADPDMLNNVGCAWALLAYLQRRLDYWPRAADTLKGVIDRVDASKEQKDRADENLGYVKAARRKKASP